MQTIYSRMTTGQPTFKHAFWLMTSLVHANYSITPNIQVYLQYKTTPLGIN